MNETIQLECSEIITPSAIVRESEAIIPPVLSIILPEFSLNYQTAEMESTTGSNNITDDFGGFDNYGEIFEIVFENNDNMQNNYLNSGMEILSENNDNSNLQVLTTNNSSNINNAMENEDDYIDDDHLEEVLHVTPKDAKAVISEIENEKEAYWDEDLEKIFNDHSDSEEEITLLNNQLSQKNSLTQDVRDMEETRNSQQTIHYIQQPITPQPQPVQQPRTSNIVFVDQTPQLLANSNNPQNLSTPNTQTIANNISIPNTSVDKSFVTKNPIAKQSVWKNVTENIENGKIILSKHHYRIFWFC